MKVALVSVSVNDPLAAHAFYTEKLGFVSRVFMPEQHLAIVVSGEDQDGTQILLEPRGNYGSREFFDTVYAKGLPVIVLGTSDIRKEVAGLKARGVVFKKEPGEQPYGTEAIFDDTCGNYLQLLQPKM